MRETAREYAYNEGDSAFKYQNSISDSWDRCRAEFRLTHDAKNPILRLMQSETRLRHEAMIERLGDDSSVIEQLAHAAASANFRVVLADTDLIAVSCFDHQTTDDEFSSVRSGSCWSERLAGTNGVSVAFENDDCITVKGSEHYFSSLRTFACTATPFFDAYGKKIGALAMVGRRPGARTGHALGEYLISNTAREIQARLFRKEFANNFILELIRGGQNQSIRSTAMIALGDHGQIIGATRCAERLLGNARVGSLYGMSSDDLLETKDAVEKCLSFNSVVVSREMTIRNVPKGREAMPGCGGRMVDSLSRSFNGGLIRQGLSEYSRGCTDMKQAELKAREMYERGLPFVIEGETGTGKTALIEAITASDLRPVSIQTLNCAAFGDAFDYHRAFATQLTEALEPGRGQSQPRVLVLDNIDELPAKLQSSLHEKLAATGLGNLSGPGAIRIIATSRNPLIRSVEDGRFRSDLFYLVAQFAVRLLPLRERSRRLRVIARLVEEHGGEGYSLSKEACERLERYPWPGNMREVVNVIRHAVLRAGPGELSVAALELGESVPAGAGPEAPRRLPEPSFSIDDREGLIQLLTRVNWNVSRAAEIVGKSRATLNRRVSQFGIKRRLSDDMAGQDDL